MTTTWSPPICTPLANSTMVPLRAKTAPRQLVRRADAVNVLHPGKNFEIASVKIHPGAHRRQHGLPLAGSAVHGKAHPDQVFYHLLDLLIGR